MDYLATQSKSASNPISESGWETAVKTFLQSLVIATSLCLSGTAALAQEAAPAGIVSLVLGKAWLHSAGSARQPLHAGAVVRVSDRISTESNGHVHIRFIDDALLSVRPDSELEVQRYDFDRDDPASVSIKLNLVEGVTRSISGEGAHVARERFRLNTPIAAIGVRGTDFAVSATEGSVRALVNEGAIVVAPFSRDCLVDTFGPCSANAVELSQSNVQMVAIDRSQPLPRLLPATDERGALNGDLVAAGNERVDAGDKATGTEVYLETVTSRRVTDVANNVVASPVLRPQTPMTPPAIKPVDFTPAASLATTEVLARNLVWGRWDGRDDMGAQERLTQTYAQASTGRDITVGNDNYGLFRDGKGSTQIKPEHAVVSFALQSAQAFYHSSSGVLALQVNGGSLRIDFNERRFATELGLSHASTGVILFTAAGRIFDAGNFYDNSDTQAMAGAVSLTGSEAGYFFEKQLDAGASLKGLTLWDAQ
jgi:hypothetical protein